MIHRDVRPLRERLGHLPASRAQLHHRELPRLAHLPIELPDASRHQNAEDRLDLLRREEVAVLAEWIARCPLGPAIVAVFGVVERHLHEAPEGHRPVAPDLPGQQLARWCRHGLMLA